MGSDLYMAERSFRPRPPRFRWEGEEFVVETDHFMSGYTEYFRVPVTTDVERSLLSKVIHCDVPPKPVASAPVTREMADAPMSAVTHPASAASWSIGWNDAVKFFNIKPEVPESEWDTYLTVDSDCISAKREDGLE